MRHSVHAHFFSVRVRYLPEIISMRCWMFDFICDAKKIKAHRELQMAYKRVRDQEAVVADDPMGKIVSVKSRGEKKPGGRGRVLAINTVKIVQQDVTFYDVEYIDDDKDMEVGKQQGGDSEANNESSNIADVSNKAPRRECAVDAMFVTFEDARFNSNGSVVVVGTVEKKPPARSGPVDYNLRQRRPSPRQQQQQQQATVLAPGFQHNLMLPPGPAVAGQSADDYEDGMSLCI
jgi:hypothetical protein